MQKQLVAWQSQKIRRIVRSTLAAETMACLDATDCGSVIWSRFGVNKSLVDCVHSTKNVLEKRLRVDIGSLRTLTATDLSVKWVPTSLQIADCLTKFVNRSNRQLSQLLHDGIMPENQT